MEKNNGKTFWDFAERNKALMVFLFIVIIGTIIFFSSKGKIKTPIFEYIPNQNEKIVKKTEINPTQLKEAAQTTIPNLKGASEEEKESIFRNEDIYTYISSIKGTQGNSITNAVINCSKCVEKQVNTDQNGKFILKCKFEKNSTFRITEVEISTPTKSSLFTLDWRDKSPQTIILK